MVAAAVAVAHGHARVHGVVVLPRGARAPPRLPENARGGRQGPLHCCCGPESRGASYPRRCTWFPFSPHSTRARRTFLRGAWVGVEWGMSDRCGGEDQEEGRGAS